MKYISQETWINLLNEYYKQKNKQKNANNKGVSFENLVESLLRKMFKAYNMVFYATKFSYDGSKDFWSLDEADELWWAECKNYGSNISITQLAPTLIMAELNDVQHLLFFSYSNLNENLKRRIGQYSYEHKKEIFIYEDEILEELLLKNLKEELFPLLALSNNFMFQPKCNIDTYFFNEKNPNQLDKKNFNGYYTIEELVVGEIYNLNVIIVNNSQPKRIKISIEELDNFFYFKVLSSEKNEGKCVKQKILDCKPNQLQMCKFIVRLIKYKEKLSLPKLFVEVLNDEVSVIPNTIPEIKYNCRWNRKDVFIGKNYEDIFSKFVSTCINMPRPSGFIVYGEGGTGKTRILEECTASLLRNDYQVLNFIGFDNNSSWKDVVREIAYSVFAISEDLKMDIICNVDLIVSPLIQDKEKENVIYLLRLLNKPNFNRKLVQKYYTVLFEKLRRTKYAIVVDNLQSYSPEILDFFNKMTQFLLQCQSESKVILLFSVNTALIYDHKYLKFISEFERVHFITKYVDGFQTEDQAISFLKTILKLDEYPLNYALMKKILSHTSLKPKYIEQVADYLIQKECIELKGEKGVVLDSSKLEEELQNIPQSFEILFSSSYQFLLEKNPECVNEAEKIISLTYLFCELNEYIINLFQLDRKVLLYLSTHDILKEIGDKNSHIYVFEHDLIEQCFYKKIYTDLAVTAIQHFKEYASCNDYVSRNWKAQYIMYGLYNEIFTADQLKKINKEIPDLSIPNKFLSKFYFYFLINLIKHKEDYMIDDFIEEALDCCMFIRNHISEVEAENVFDIVYPHIFDIQLCTQNIMRKHFAFVIHYCENKCRLKDVSCAIQTYNRYAQKLCLLLENNVDLKEKIIYAQAYIDNRIFVCGKLEGKPDKYIENLKHSLKISRRHGFADILFENYFDASNLYFFKEINMEKGILLLNKGFKSFHKMPPDVAEKFKVNYYSKNILYYMITKQYKEALSKVDEALDFIANNNVVNYHLFFKCRYLKYKITCLILLNQIDNSLDNTFEEYEKILRIINKNDDLERYFLQAKYAFVNKNKENFAVLFENYYHKVANEINSINYERDIRMLLDLAIKYRMLFGPETFQGINNRAKPLCHVNEILLMNNQDFQQFFFTYKSSAPIVDEEGKDGYFV